MTTTSTPNEPHDHEHDPKRIRVLIARAGVPYEIEQQVCAACLRVLDEKSVKRAAA
jgi:hypothetical protein